MHHSGLDQTDLCFGLALLRSAAIVHTSVEKLPAGKAVLQVGRIAEQGLVVAGLAQ